MKTTTLIRSSVTEVKVRETTKSHLDSNAATTPIRNIAGAVAVIVRNSLDRKFSIRRNVLFD